MMGDIFNTFDEIDDSVSYEKLNSYLEVVDNQLKRLRNFQSKQQETEESSSHINRCAAQLKRMKRFKRYFLFRKLIFEIRLKGELTEEMIEKFRKDFEIEGDVDNKAECLNGSKKTFFLRNVVS